MKAKFSKWKIQPSSISYEEWSELKCPTCNSKDDLQGVALAVLHGKPSGINYEIAGMSPHIIEDIEEYREFYPIMMKCKKCSYKIIWEADLDITNEDVM